MINVMDITNTIQIIATTGLKAMQKTRKCAGKPFADKKNVR